MDDKQILQKKRKQARLLHFEKHLNKTEIAKELGVSWNFVHKWTKDLSAPIHDQRGWPQGKKRTRTNQEELRIIMIRKQLQEGGFFHGADKILEEYIKLFPDEPELTRSFVSRVISLHFPMSRRRSLKAVKEQKYPLGALSSLGEIQEEADFLGKKYLRGSSDPVHFFTRVYKKPFTLRLIKRVPNQGSETILDTFTEDWKDFPLPDVLSIDNGFGFTASGWNPRILSPFIQYLLLLGVAPLFIAPKKPWMNGSVEGTHSVFARKVWNRFDFQNLQEVDETVARFQKEYRIYSKTPEVLPGKTLDEAFTWQDILQKPFRAEEGMCIYLVRLVQEYEKDQFQLPAIRLFKELVELDSAYLNTYVLVHLDVFQEQLSVYVQPEEDLQLIAKRDFPLRFAEKKY